jgi:hypothetical protein
MRWFRRVLSMKFFQTKNKRIGKSAFYRFFQIKFLGTAIAQSFTQTSEGALGLPPSPY